MTRWIRIIFLALMVGCGPSPPDLPPLDGLEAEVQAALYEAHTRAADNPSAQNMGELGLTLFAFDFPRQAREALTTAAREAPRHSDWPYYLGVLARREGGLEEAVAQFRQAARLSTGDLLPEIRLAESLLETGDFEEATTRLLDVLESDSTLTMAHTLLGESYLESGKHQEAVGHLRTALALQPQATQMHAPLASALAALGDAMGSEFHRQRRGNRPVRIHDRRMAALDSLRLTVGATLVLRAEALMRQGNYEEAANLLEAAVLDDNSATTLIKLGVARANSGSFAGAIGAFRDAITADPTSDQAHFNLGMMALAVGDTASAEISLRAATQAGGFNLEAHVELASLLRRAGRCADALPHLNQALRNNPPSTSIRLDLILCLNHEGRDREAVAVLEEGLQAAPDNLAIVDALARLLATSGDPFIRDPDRALELAEAALALQQRTETLETTALALAAVGGRRDDAIRVLDQAIAQADRDRLQMYRDHLVDLRASVERQRDARAAWPHFVYLR